MDRYHRQTLLPQIGSSGQARLAASRVLLVGCGALGTVMAEQLVRAGVGFLRIVDRDWVELTNLQRQLLFDEQDVREQTPKAIAAARRLGKVNSSVVIEPVVTDLHSGNVEQLITVTPSSGVSDEGNAFDLILDGADSVETRYLLNDVSVKHGIPWIYGACVAMTGRALAIRPPKTACLRCLFPTPPSPGELPTCDTAGVFSPVSAIVASLQTAAAIKLLIGAAEDFPPLYVLDVWDNFMRAMPTTDSKRSDCPTCGQRRFEFLDHPSGSSTTALCGRNAMQVRPAASNAKIDLPMMARKLSAAGAIETTPYLLRCQLPPPENLKLTLFPDARLIIHGVTDPDRARSIYARYVGA